MASTTPSTTGCPGRTATPCTASTPVVGDHLRGPVVAAGAGAGEHDHQVAGRRRVAHRRGDERRAGRARSRVTVTSAPSSAPGRRASASWCPGSRPGRAARRPAGSRRRWARRPPAARAARRPRSPRPRRPPPGRTAAAGGRRAAAARSRRRPHRSSGRASTARSRPAARPRRHRVWCTSSRITTASRPAGIGSPVSTTSKAPAGEQQRRALARADGVGRRAPRCRPSRRRRSPATSGSAQTGAGGDPAQRRRRPARSRRRPGPGSRPPPGPAAQAAVGLRPPARRETNGLPVIGTASRRPSAPAGSPVASSGTTSQPSADGEHRQQRRGAEQRAGHRLRPAGARP